MSPMHLYLTRPPPVLRLSHFLTRTTRKRDPNFVSESVFPQNLDVMRTRSELLGVELVIGNIADFPWLEAEQFSGILV